MQLQDKFTPEEEKAYTGKVDDILKLIKAFRDQNKGQIKEPKIQAHQTAYLLDRLEQAFKDLKTNISQGRKQWFRHYQDICHNYRFSKGLNEVWVTIASRYDEFWFNLSLKERMFINMGSNSFWIPNFKNKGYEPLYNSLLNDFQKKLNTLEDYKDTKLDISKQTDVYQIRIPEHALPQMYTIVVGECKIEVTVNPNAKSGVKQAITDFLFSFLCDYLEV